MLLPYQAQQTYCIALQQERTFLENHNKFSRVSCRDPKFFVMLNYFCECSDARIFSNCIHIFLTSFIFLSSMLIYAGGFARVQLAEHIPTGEKVCCIHCISCFIQSYF